MERTSQFSPKFKKSLDNSQNVNTSTMTLQKMRGVRVVQVVTTGDYVTTLESLQVVLGLSI